MKLKNLLLLTLTLVTIAPVAVLADDYVDDIYFNPKKDKQVGAKKKNPNYIENFSDIDVDTYNLRGQYYSTPIDTIGAKVSTEEDFVYTQQIQKYYNPTIVLDNSQMLADVLQNSYGNVEIVFNGLTPAFLPTYGYGWPYYRSYYDPWYWNVGFGGWSIGGWYDPWYWCPAWSWGWGPSWSWGPSWGWGGPGWGPGHVGPAPGWQRPNSTWSPGGNRPVNPGVGWAGGHRPSNSRPASVAGRPGSNRPSSSGSQWSIGGNRRQSNAPTSSGSRNHNAAINNSGNGSVSTATNNNRRGNNTYNSTTNSNRNNSNVNSNRNTNSTHNSGSYNSTRGSNSGSFGSGGFGGGSRSGGGNSGRGHRR